MGKNASKGWRFRKRVRKLGRPKNPGQTLTDKRVENGKGLIRKPAELTVDVWTKKLKKC